MRVSSACSSYERGRQYEVPSVTPWSRYRRARGTIPQTPTCFRSARQSPVYCCSCPPLSSVAGGACPMARYRDSGPPPQVVSVSLYGPRFPARTPSSWSRRPALGVGARLRRRSVAEPLDEPLGVVAVDELADDLLGLREARELVQVDALLF